MNAPTIINKKSLHSQLHCLYDQEMAAQPGMMLGRIKNSTHPMVEVASDHSPDLILIYLRDDIR